MLRLRNIERDNGMISASYEPENSGKIGVLKVDIETGEVIGKELSDYDKDFPWYFGHAVTALKEIANEDEVPKKD